MEDARTYRHVKGGSAHDHIELGSKVVGGGQTPCAASFSRGQQSTEEASRWRPERRMEGNARLRGSSAGATTV